MSTKKMYFNDSQKSIGAILFEVSLFRIHFLSALQYLDCYYDKYLVKQTVSLYLKFTLNPTLVCFCYFWKDKSFLILNLSLSEYLYQRLPWKEM